jgi:hypothetical protein
MVESKDIYKIVDEADQEIKVGEKLKIDGIEDHLLMRNVVTQLIVKIKMLILILLNPDAQEINIY